MRGIQNIVRTWKILVLAESVLWSVASMLLMYLLFYISDSEFRMIGTAITGIAAFVGTSIKRQLWQIGNKEAVSLINRQFPTLEFSGELLISQRPDSILHQLQLEKIISAWPTVAKVRYPHHIPTAALVATLSLTILFLVTRFSGHSVLHKPNDSSVLAGGASTSTEATIRSVVLSVTPPGYTKRPAYKSQQLNIKVPEGSVVTWNLTIEPKPERVWMITSNGDSINLELKEASWSVTRTVESQGFYSLYWMDNGELRHTDYQPIEVIRDFPPIVKPFAMELYTEVEPGMNDEVRITMDLEDDYGLTDARIVATVAKGSGEGIKFREEVFRFTEPLQFGGRHYRGKKSLSLSALTMEPGDELYFYAEAIDNKRPSPQISRTETLFVSIRDTANMQTIADNGLGVDLMPEYFRSQRQIIIDSEKLLKEKKSIAVKDFNFRSNELGYDQKVLRLRYGQFLGEEFESGIGPAESHTEESEDDEEDPSRKYMHNHDAEEERQNGENVKRKDANEHEHDQGEEDEKNPLAAWAHQHDNTEEATFFIQSVKTKLRAALTLMWDAELHLRMYDPAKSLPYQYKILALLKEISQDSRIYVHRTGFDPPPIKEERRLSGDLTELGNGGRLTPTAQDMVAPLRELLANAERWKADTTLSGSVRATLEMAGRSIAQASMEDISLLPALSSVRQLLDGKGERLTAWLSVQQACWKLIGQAPASLTPTRTPILRPEKRFLDIQSQQP